MNFLKEDATIYLGLIMQYPLSVIVAALYHVFFSGKSFLPPADEFETDSEYLRFATQLYILVCLETTWRLLIFIYPEGTSVLKFLLHSSITIVALEWGMTTIWRFTFICVWKPFRDYVPLYSVTEFNTFAKIYLDVVMMLIAIAFFFISGTYKSLRNAIYNRFMDYVRPDRCVECGSYTDCSPHIGVITRARALAEGHPF